MSRAMSDLRLGDAQTFLAVRRWSSVTGAARSLRVTPSQVSKAVARLEAELGLKLLTRGPRGVSLTPSGQRAAASFEEIVRRVEILRASASAPELTIAAPAFLSALFLPLIAESLSTLRVRGVELPPSLVSAYAAENLYDLAITVGEERFPDGWESTNVGSVRSALYATPKLARSLGPFPVNADRLTEVPFITPVYNHGGQFLLADEGCPIGDKRRLGHEVHTIALALELAARTGQLVFGPVIAARAHVERRALVEVPVKGWDVREELFVTCNAERMRAADHRELVRVVKAELEALEPGR